MCCTWDCGFCDWQAAIFNLQMVEEKLSGTAFWGWVIPRQIDQLKATWQALQAYILARDQVVFKALFFSGDRAADLLGLLTHTI